MCTCKLEKEQQAARKAIRKKHWDHYVIHHRTKITERWYFWAAFSLSLLLAFAIRLEVDGMHARSMFEVLFLFAFILFPIVIAWGFAGSDEAAERQKYKNDYPEGGSHVPHHFCS